ncbi:MAG TPA: ABC transporter permease, partial [Bryobacteraceae bacterium]|nr:ABC transporter permease [Bryobacteraceae bacterium]
FQLPGNRYPNAQAQRSFYDRLEARLEAIPGVNAVTIASTIPSATGSAPIPYEIGGEQYPGGIEEQQRRPAVSRSIIGPGYFRTLGVPVAQGREFNRLDTVAGVSAVVINQHFASRNWPGADPIGKRVRLFSGNNPEAWRTVVGVVPNIVWRDRTRQELDSAVYVPYDEKAGAAMWVLARTEVSIASVADRFRREVQAIDSDLPPVLGPISLAERLAETYHYRATTGILFLICAGVAVLLASIGLYAVIAHSVSQRTQEIGVRLALGGTAANIGNFVLRLGMVPMLVGLAIGLPASIAANRILKAQLVQVSPADPITLSSACVVLAVAAILGCLVPARRAMRVDPATTLKFE